MTLKNYTTGIDVNKTIMEIESLLVRFGAKSVYKEYTGSRISALMFVVEKKGNKIPFRLPTSIEKARGAIALIVKEKKLPQRYLSEPLQTEQGERVMWRIIKDWVESQLSLIELNYADAVKILLPYAYDYGEKKTMYQKFIENTDKYIAIENKSEEK
jgi:hypothetical protein